jgi:hypothetical protein
MYARLKLRTIVFAIAIFVIPLALGGALSFTLGWRPALFGKHFELVNHIAVGIALAIWPPGSRTRAEAMAPCRQENRLKLAGAEPVSVFLIRRSAIAFDASCLLVKAIHHGAHEESSHETL